MNGVLGLSHVGNSKPSKVFWLGYRTLKRIQWKRNGIWAQGMQLIKYFR